jgi:hypothetical protein
MSQLSGTLTGKQAATVSPENSAASINTPVCPVSRGPENSAPQSAVFPVFPSPFRGTEKTGKQMKLTRFDGYAGDGRKTPHEHRNEEQDDGKIQ